jgi:NADPH-dependent curcumin reductase CurA
MPGPSGDHARERFDRLSVTSSHYYPHRAQVYGTAHYALVTCARVKKGDTVLIHGAAGGIGHAAMSICKFYGCRVLATAGSDAKRKVRRQGKGGGAS